MITNANATPHANLTHTANLTLTNNIRVENTIIIFIVTDTDTVAAIVKPAANKFKL